HGRVAVETRAKPRAAKLGCMNLAEPPVYEFRPEDRPVLPGGPFAPPHPALRKLGYGAVAVLAGVASTFDNALVNTNVASLAGSLGFYVAEASVLPAIFFAMNASTNLLLIKARIQLGVPRTVYALLGLYIVAGLAQFFFTGFAAAVTVRAASGMAGGALIALRIFFLLQGFPPQLRPAAPVLRGGVPPPRPPR